MEKTIMELIVNAGNARSRAMEAISAANNGEVDIAKKKMIECEDALDKAHDIQTNLIQKEAAGEKIEINLLVIHAQDHLMNAATIKDMAKEFIKLYEKFNK